MDSAYIGVSDETPMASLLLEVPPDDEGRERRVSLAVIPDEAGLEEVDLVQWYMSLPIESDEAEPRLPATNENSILGHAGRRESGEYYFRHIWPVARGIPVIGPVVFEVLQLFVFSADLATQALSAD